MSSSGTPPVAVVPPSAADPQADALSLEDRVRELEAHSQRLEARDRSIEEIALALGSTLDLDELLVLIMNGATQLLDAQRSTLFLVDHDRGVLWSKIAQDSGVEEIKVQLGEGLAGAVAKSGETLNIADAYDDPRFKKEWDRRTGFRTRSVLCHPIRNKQGSIIGVIQVLNKKSGLFLADDESLLAALCAQVGVSLENSRLFASVLSKNAELIAIEEQLRIKMSELEFLYQAEQEAGLAEGALDRVLQRTTDALDASAGAILLLGDGGEALYCEHAAGARGAAVAARHARFSLDRGLAAAVARRGEPVLSIGSADSDAPRDPALAAALGVPGTSVLGVPLVSDGGVAGVLALFDKKSGDFTSDDLKLLTLAAAIVSRVVSQARHREAQERASRLADLGQMLSGVLHDFKTPMTIISGYAQLMASEQNGLIREESCEAILRQFEHVSHMTREVLAFARGDSKMLLRRVFVGRFMEEVAELLSREFESRQITFTVECRYRGAARFDEGKLRRVIYNISRNALEAMTPGKGSFRIVLDSSETELAFEFIDTGPGIPSEVQSRLFQSFVTKGKSGGTGLGLAIVKKIAGEHQGSVRYETSPGKGTTFFFRIPIDPDGALVTSDSGEQGGTTGGAG